MASDRGLFIVADGMGGHAAGEVASEMATRIIAEEFRPARGMSDEELMSQMVGAIRAANESIFHRTLVRTRQARHGNHRPPCSTSCRAGT